MARLTTRPSFVREFYRLTDTDATDEALTEHDGGVVLEGVYRLLSDALLEAQDDLMRFGYGDYWLQRSTAVLSFVGVEDTDGGTSADLPADFRRAYGDEDDSCLVKANGDRWGQEIAPEHRQLKGDFYYFRGGQLWLARSASLPAGGVFLEYYRRPAELSDSVTADFPEEFRVLVPAHAAVMAAAQPWYAGDQLDEARLQRHLEDRRRRAFSMTRPSRRKRTVAPRPMGGATHWWG